METIGFVIHGKGGLAKWLGLGKFGCFVAKCISSDSDGQKLHIPQSLYKLVSIFNGLQVKNMKNSIKKQ